LFRDIKVHVVVLLVLFLGACSGGDGGGVTYPAGAPANDTFGGDAPRADTLESPDSGGSLNDSNEADSSQAPEPDTTPAPEPDTTPPPEPFSCDNMPTEPVIDASIFPPCCDGAHCVPKNLVPADLHSALIACPDNPETLCIPDEFIEFNSFFVPPTCTVPGNLEGRCLSACLPIVADSIDKLTQADCVGNTRCVPCCDPLTGESLGACDVGCDTGPETGVCTIAFKTCCKDNQGHCIPTEMIPEEFKDNLNDDGCDAGYLCLPDVFQDDDFKPSACSGEIPFGPSYTGVCLPKCIDITLDDLIWSGSCGSNDDCVPCKDPLSGEPTGAPGCP
jgi:hypothetical protein